MIRGDMDIARAIRDPHYLFEVKRFLRRDVRPVRHVEQLNVMVKNTLMRVK